MSQIWKTKAPLVDFQGNNGSIDGDKAAAQRYPEVKKTKFTELLLKDINKNTVDFVPSFAEDPEDDEPKVLPARYPNLLVNGTFGIAVGMASSIPPHNFNEAMRAVIALLEKESITTKELVEKYLPAPDFPLGGTIINKREMLECYETGKGKAVIRANYTIDEKQRVITFNDIPFGETKSKVFNKMLEIYSENIIPGISKVEDTSGDNIMVRLEVTYKKGADPQEIIKQLYLETPLQSNYSFNMNALVDGEPQRVTLKDILYHYAKHLIEIHKRAITFDLDKLRSRLHILYGYKIVLEDIDNVIELIKKSENPAQAMERLSEKYGLTQIQSKSVVDLKLGRITSLEVEKIEKEIADKELQVSAFQELLDNDGKLRAYIIQEIEEIVKTTKAPERITVLEDVELLTKSKAKAKAKQDMVLENKETNVYLDDAGTIKRCDKTTTSKKIAIGFSINTTDDILIFTQKGTVTKMTVGTLIETNTAAESGQKLETMEEDDLIIYVTPLNYDFIAHVTKDNLIKKSQMSEFRSISRPAIKALNLGGEDEIKSIFGVNEGDEIVAMNSQGFALKISETEIRATGRATKGVKIMNEGPIIGARVVGKKDDPLAELKVEPRGRKGIEMK